MTDGYEVVDETDEWVDVTVGVNQWQTADGRFVLEEDYAVSGVVWRVEALVAPLDQRARFLFREAGGGLGVARDLVNSLYGATFLNKEGFTALDAFSVSFTTHANDGEFEREHGLPSQWTNYAGPDGFCLVFDTPQMANHLGREFDSRYWVRLALDPVH